LGTSKLHKPVFFPPLRFFPVYSSGNGKNSLKIGSQPPGSPIFLTTIFTYLPAGRQEIVGLQKSWFIP